jgi:hypothetical protein
MLPTTLTPEEQLQHLAEAREDVGEVIRRLAITLAPQDARLRHGPSEIDRA